MHIMFNAGNVASKKSKFLCFASKENFLKIDGVKSNDENMMKNNDEIPSSWKWEWRYMFFWVIL